MSSAGPNSPSSVDSEGMGTAWSNPGNATASDNTYATCSTPFNGVNSKYLRCYGFGFALPVGATITEISVSVERKADNNSASYNVVDQTVQLTTTSLTRVGDNLAAAGYWPTSDTVKSYAPGTLWNSGLGVADINAAGFGVSVRCSFSNIDEGVSITASIDAVTITITYTAGGSTVTVSREAAAYQPLMRY